MAEDVDDEDLLGGVIPGLKVYDVDGNLVGTVEAIDQTAGTMRVATNPFFEEAMVIRLDLIVSINSRELFVSRSR